MRARPETKSAYEVAIAGAGPGGVAVARRLVRRRPELAGRIALFDRARFPRDKPCGGGLAGHAIDAMTELGLELDVPHQPCSDARIGFGSERNDVRLGRAVNVVSRTDYDASLVAQLRADGVEVAEGEGVRRFSVERDAVVIETGRGRTVRAQVLVGADGAASIVRKHLHGGARGVPHRLFRAEMALPVGAAASANAARMVYDFSLMARGLRGYLWVFPMPPEANGAPRVNVGLMHYPGRERLTGAELTSLLREGLASHGLRLGESDRTRGWPAWGYHPGAPVSAQRLLTVGDAAGIDGLTGEGIGVALEHGIAAADAIVSALEGRDFSFAGYRRALRRATVGRELAVDRWLARLLYATPLWREWLSLVLYDGDVVQLYADRVAGTTVLADQKRAMIAALARHAIRLPARRRALARVETAARATIEAASRPVHPGATSHSPRVAPATPAASRRRPEAPR